MFRSSPCSKIPAKPLGVPFLTEAPCGKPKGLIGINGNFQLIYLPKKEVKP
jgi:hypothetical protein